MCINVDNVFCLRLKYILVDMCIGDWKLNCYSDGCILNFLYIKFYLF